VENPAEYFLGSSAEVSLGNPLHEFASEYLPRSERAKTFYRSQRQKGKSHHIAVRILAFKWIRVIFRCWNSSQPSTR
jgi:hypothetical protein